MPPKKGKKGSEGNKQGKIVLKPTLTTGQQKAI